MNILASPSAINVSPWSVGGTGVSATSATTLQTGSGASGIAQTVTVVPGMTYLAEATVATSSGTNGTVGLTIYSTSYSTNYGASAVITLSSTGQTLRCLVEIPAGVTSCIFELDYNSTSSAVESITNCAMLQLNSLSLLGCGC